MEGPRSAGDWRRDADAHYEAERWQDAALAFEQALALDPRQAEAWYRLGNARQELGEEPRALACFEKAVALDAAHAKAWNNVGVSREKLGEPLLAEAAYRRALEHDPQLLPALRNFAQLALRLGHRVEAEEAHRKAMAIVSPLALPHIKAAAAALAGANYPAAEASLSAALALIPGHPILGHMLAAVRGEKRDGASRAYVSAMFDDFAASFDRSLGELGYIDPQRLAQAVAPLLPAAARIADLGCGTGLLGAALAPGGARITGIDLSAKMLEHAAARRVYERLIEGDIAEELERMPAGGFDAVLATDVFIYVGDLARVFAATARALAPQGVFGFTAEALEEGDFVLQPTGRFAHSAAYLRRLAAQYGFAERRMERVPSRRERDKVIESWLVCLSAGAAIRPVSIGAPGS